jgi:hypothetical protein
MKNFNKFLISTLSLLLLSIIAIVAMPTNIFADGPAMINLGGAGSFTILAKTGISTTGTTSIVGNIGLSPAAASYITGFSLNLPAASAFSTSVLVKGEVFAPDYATPTPANITTAVSDMESAYTTAAGVPNPAAIELGAGNIGGMTLTPGVYKWTTGLTIPANLILSGGSNDVWIFQIAQNLDVSPATQVLLSGGAQAANVFWVVAGQTTLGTNSVFNGNILDQTAIVLNTGAVLNGRALAQTAVTLASNIINKPTYSYLNNGGGYQLQSNNDGSNYISPIIMPTSASSATTGTYNFGVTTLKNGSTGTAVVDLQKFLNAKLNLGLTLDGKLGSKTIAVIKQWQKAHGLTADGLIGTKTKALMTSSTQ